MFNPQQIKKDFPLLAKKIHGKNIVYLDNASTTQKPRQIISAIKTYYEKYNANVHRGIYKLAEQATEKFEDTRKLVATFINAKSEKEIIFTRSCTESINLVAYTFGEKFIKKGDEIIVSELEHHANLVPWQELVKRKQAKLKIIPLKNDYTLDLDIYKKLLNKKTKLIAITAMSNVTGTVTDLKTIIKQAKKFNAKVLIDGAQSVAHLKTDVQNLDCDFLTFSSHKMLGPTGIGILYGKTELLKSIPPFNFGGEMIKEVSQFKSTFAEIPWKFEAGTPNIADIIAFSEAIKYLQKKGLKNIEKHEKQLTKQAKKIFDKYPQIKTFLPPEKHSSGIISFTIKGIHPHDIAQIFDSEGICIRAGHHCAQPLIKRLGTPATARISFYLYNTEQDLKTLEKALKKTIKTFSK